MEKDPLRKVCNGPLCKGQERSVTEFYKCEPKKDGLQDWCKKCSKEQSKQYYRENKEKLNERSKQDYHNNKEERQEYSKEYGQTLNRRYYVYKRSARERGLEFTLTLEQFEFLTSQSCCYCGGHTEDREFCGIDRIDNDVGYVSNNCVPCCTVCNYMRHKQTQKEFVNRCHTISAYSKGR